MRENLNKDYFKEKVSILIEMEVHMKDNGKII